MTPRRSKTALVELIESSEMLREKTVINSPIDAGDLIEDFSNKAIFVQDYDKC